MLWLATCGSPRLVGYGVAMDILGSGRVFLAEEAAEMGVVNKVFPPEELLERSLAYAADIAANVSPRALAVTKHQLNTHPGWALSDAMADTYRLTDESLLRPDFREGVQSFMEKRPPRFAPWTGGDPTAP